MNASCLIRANTIALVVFLLTGCTRNVSNKPEYWGGTRVGEEYRLTSDAFLRGHGRPSIKHYYISSPGTGHYFNSPTIEAYRSLPDHQWSPRILGILDRGTRVRIVKLEWWKSFKGNWGVSTFAVIVDGQFADQKVTLDDVLEHPDPRRAGVPDPKLLELLRAVSESNGE